jgi:glycosyltransferase involved in cell wall biosynthesis
VDVGKIYFVCPEEKKVKGGIKQLYRQVDVLNKHGFDAYILHENQGFRYTWFKNLTKISYSKEVFDSLSLYKPLPDNSLKGKLKRTIKNILYSSRIAAEKKQRALDIKITSKDILVLPEVYGPNITKTLVGVRKVIYNQNCYYTFRKFEDYPNSEIPYNNKDVVAIIVASEDAKEYLTFAFPNMPVYRVKYGIDGNMFSYSLNKKKQVAFMPRKLQEDIIQIIEILKSRNNLKDWQFMPIDNMNENEVASVLRDSMLFLSLNYREGFGMPPAEAMSCGCIVVGYHGMGGKEYLKEEFSYSIQDRDIISFVKQIEFIIEDFENNQEKYLSKGKMASDYISKEYSMQMEEQTIISTWKSILNL